MKVNLTHYMKKILSDPRAKNILLTAIGEGQSVVFRVDGKHYRIGVKSSTISSNKNVCSSKNITTHIIKINSDIVWHPSQQSFELKSSQKFRADFSPCDIDK